MPQLTLDYSNNITQTINFKVLFSQLHRVLHQVGNVNIDNCKSRAIRQNEYYVGNGIKENAFAHLEIRFLEGRPMGLKQAIGEACLQILETHLEETIDKLNPQITVEIVDIPKSSYFKFPSGTLA